MLYSSTPYRCGKKVDYRFYHQLEKILGEEAVSLDEYDEREEQADQEPGTISEFSHISTDPEDTQKLLHLWPCLCLPAEVADIVNTPWTEEETVALIEVWAADDVQHSLKTSVRNGHVYAEIAEKMSTLGYLKSAEQCQTRIKRLKKTYRRYCNNRR